jgi:phosphate transport system protein
MSIHLQADLQNLHKELLSMSSSVEDMVHRAIALLSEPDVDAARQLSEQDTEVDRFDVDLEENCLKILALHQPVAIDLRRLTMMLKIVGELERVADLAVNIAQRSCALLDAGTVVVPDGLKDMALQAVDMLHRSIDAYVELDAGIAQQVCLEDDDIDAANDRLISQLVHQMQEHPDRIDALLHLFSAVRHVERVADHATNIAEDVVYMVEGRIIRHARKLMNAQAQV